MQEINQCNQQATQGQTYTAPSDNINQYTPPYFVPYMPSYPLPQSPCPGCGRCPVCGGYKAVPQYPQYFIWC